MSMPLDLLQCQLDGQANPSTFIGCGVQPASQQVGADVALAVQHVLLQQPSSGLHIPSDMTPFWDPIAIGQLLTSTRSNLMMIGAVVSTPHVAGSNGNSALLLASPSEGSDGRGPAKFETLMKGLLGSNLPLRCSQGTLANVAVDGQCARGELHAAKLHNHNPLSTATLPLERLHRQQLVAWDYFHGLCKSGVASWNKSQLSCVCSQLLQIFKASFNSSQGKMMDRQLH